MKVLLLVDIQNDFCPGGALAVPQGNEVVEVANALMASGEFDLTLASLDWHTRDNVSFAQNHPGKRVGDDISIDYEGTKVKQHLWPVHCVAGTVGAELHSGLNTEKIDGMICKGTHPAIDSYSAFFDNGQVQQTALFETLKNEAEKRGESVADIELSVCGLATDYCVAATAQDARSLGLRTSLIVDGCRAVNVNPGDELLTLRDLKNAGVRLITSKDIVRPREQERALQAQSVSVSKSVEISRGV